MGSSVHRGTPGAQFTPCGAVAETKARDKLAARSAVISDEWNSLEVDPNVPKESRPESVVSVAQPGSCCPHSGCDWDACSVFFSGCERDSCGVSFSEPRVLPPPPPPKPCCPGSLLLAPCGEVSKEALSELVACLGQEQPLSLSVTGFPTQCRPAPPIGFCFQLSENTRRPSRVSWVPRPHTRENHDAAAGSPP